MKKLLVYISAPLVALTIASCEKEIVPGPTGNPVPNGAQLSNFFSVNESAKKQHFTISASTGGMLTGNKGTRIYIQPNSFFTSLGAQVTGTVDVELIEVYDRATMVLLNKPTVARKADGSRATLVSGGEYYLRFSQGGQEVLAPSGVQVEVPAQNMGGLDNQMSLFDGTMFEGMFTWEATEDTIVPVQDSTGGSYFLFDNEWGWTNVDRFYDDPRPKTVLKVKLPDGYNQTNAEVYVTYDGEPRALASLDIFTDGYFSEHYGLIPIGLQVHFIVVMMIDNELHYAIRGATITDGHIETISDFEPTTQNELVALINALP